MSAPLSGQRFQNRRYAITGAGSGIGHALTELLCAEGAEVLALDRRFPLDMPDGADCIIANVCDAHELAEAVARVGDGLDGLATFAGIEMGGRIDSVDIASWQRVFEVNVLGSVRSIQSFLPALRQRKGAIVLCSSQLSLAGARDCVAYAASKGAVNVMTRALALDHAAEGIRVNAIAPGATETPMMGRAFKGQPEAARAASRQRHAMGRFGTSMESAVAAAFLLDPGASFITGVVMPVDGGWSAA